MRVYNARTLGAVLVATLALVACSANQAAVVDRVAGSEEPIVLTMADFSGGLYHNPALQHFVDKVEEDSGGAVQIEVLSEWGGFVDGVERMVVDDVASGKADLAWLPTRAFDTMGINHFRALNAPMLIDSYAVQAAVLSSEIATEMLPSLEQLGVTGLAMLADGLRKPISVDAPLLSLQDYQGITFTSTLSETHAEAISALGAKTDDAIAQDRAVGLRSGEIQGFEMNLLGYRANENQYLAPYVAANVNLWASPIVLLANPSTIDELTPEGRDVILGAAKDAAEASITMIDVDSGEVDILCDTGARFGTASNSDLQEMREAFQPVYESLAEEATTADFLSRIEAIKAETPADPVLVVPPDCTGESPIVVVVESDEPAELGAGNDGRFAGTYRWELTEAEVMEFLDANGSVPELEYQIATLPWLLTTELTEREWTMQVTDNTGETVPAGGTYASDGDRIIFDWPSARYELGFTIKLNADGSLELVPDANLGPADRFVWANEPWQRID
jgi:TRAP-type C4-dicarboxylate transport system substrate-binding protein